MKLNEHDIDMALETIRERAPHVAHFAKYLSDWKDTVNSNSDGWAYWRAGSAAADKLATLVEQTMHSLRGRGGPIPTVDQFKRSLPPIKSAATRFKLQAPTLGEPEDAGMAPRR